MQRLTDILDNDLDWIFKEARDFTYSVVLQAGAEKITLLASLQADNMQADASADPLNAYSLTLYCLESDITETFKKHLSKNGVIYINAIAHKIVDTTVDMGRVRRLAVTKQSSRGTVTPRPLG